MLINSYWGETDWEMSSLIKAGNVFVFYTYCNQYADLTVRLFSTSRIITRYFLELRMLHSRYALVKLPKKEKCSLVVSESKYIYQLSSRLWHKRLGVNMSFLERYTSTLTFYGNLMQRSSWGCKRVEQWKCLPRFTQLENLSLCLRV